MSTIATAIIASITNVFVNNQNIKTLKMKCRIDGSISSIEYNRLYNEEVCIKCNKKNIIESIRYNTLFLSTEHSWHSGHELCIPSSSLSEDHQTMLLLERDVRVEESVIGKRNYKWFYITNITKDDLNEICEAIVGTTLKKPTFA